MTLHELVQAVKHHAHKHYNQGGWDVVVEQWTDWSLTFSIAYSQASTVEEAINAIAEEAGVKRHFEVN